MRATRDKASSVALPLSPWGQVALLCPVIPSCRHYPILGKGRASLRACSELPCSVKVGTESLMSRGKERVVP